ncbi:hypothetical protein F5876DRAFT_75761 [Lentinula aff. lateritia]|uniref:Uncharacterized protein n=1 Tax=Lentinula aff. lateritia TaxID=2804960 RepID=A0ACC1U3W8_9AGAR|nr:hypothetical protein F5876DRAFT_75761 [Lentinula aff. lateritia]
MPILFVLDHSFSGRNVCVNFPLECCSRNKRCSYRHSIVGLAEDVTTKLSRDSTFTLQLQWWNDPARMQENATEDSVEAGSPHAKKKENVLPDVQTQTTNRKNKQFYPRGRSTSEEKSSTMSSAKLQSIGSNTKEKERKKEKKPKARVSERAVKRDQTEESAAPDRKEDFDNTYLLSRVKDR